MSNKLLCVETDIVAIQDNQIELADTVRLLLFQQYPAWFEQLSYENDRSFLEPALFYLFSEKSAQILPITQLLYGHLAQPNQPVTFDALSDPFGLVYLSNYGVLSTEQPNHTFTLDGSQLVDLTKNINFFSESIQLNKHVPFILYTDKNLLGHFVDSIAETLKKYKTPLAKAVDLLRKWVPEFWQLVELVTCEISVFNSTNLRSMGAISYHGTAFINTEGQLHDEVFFVEDLAHQCGHIIFNALTLQTQSFLEFHKDTPLANWTGVYYETRSVYGTFHGLFTYTTILHCLTKCIKSEAFNASQRLEALARIGFFMQKFEMDLKYMHKPEIYTRKGKHMYDAILVGFEQVKNEFETSYKQYRYDNQPYIFNYALFQQANSPANEKFGFFFRP